MLGLVASIDSLRFAELSLGIAMISVLFYSSIYSIIKSLYVSVKTCEAGVSNP